MNVAGMTSLSLTMKPTSFSSGIPSCYCVLGLPYGQAAELILKRLRMVDVWKVRFGGRGLLKGRFATAELALAAVQSGAIVTAKKD